MIEGLDMNRVVGSHDVVMITLDTLRYDVARDCFLQGRTPNLAALIGPDGWEERYTPGSFTYAAHHAFFAGFLPTPKRPGQHPRRFAASFHGSTTTSRQTCVFKEADIVSGLRDRGYHTVCIGGVGFFNKQTALGKVLPSMFDESHWGESMGVTAPDSTQHQLDLASQILDIYNKNLFLFINVSALHQPNCHYLEGATEDTLESHAAALEYVDRCLPILTDAIQKRQRPCFLMLMADHGTAYGEQGFWGHRIGHEVVMTVPYAEALYTPEDAL